ncbi:hypothetical protein ElyMa_002440800 [Elysia marginata]|uniref:Uncharacterized protein n=1 Tax=Elysia marginata TaxID=1093978 RepID=A0AAV4GJB7_9GAST|nr:hypothetical protein ElyMa_002440800 [Elysia marginata]
MLLKQVTEERYKGVMSMVLTFTLTSRMDAALPASDLKRGPATFADLNTFPVDTVAKALNTRAVRMRFFDANGFNFVAPISPEAAGPWSVALALAFHVADGSLDEADPEGRSAAAVRPGSGAVKPVRKAGLTRSEAGALRKQMHALDFSGARYCVDLVAAVALNREHDAVSARGRRDLPQSVKKASRCVGKHGRGQSPKEVK